MTTQAPPVHDGSEFPDGPQAVPVKFAPPEIAAEFEQAAREKIEAELESELAVTVEAQPCYLLDEDGEPHPVRKFYMVEDDTGAGTWVLRRRTSESGFGAPLLWADRNQVAQMLRLEAMSSGCFGDSRVITVQVTHRDPPEVLCVYCDEWGHREKDCEDLTGLGQGEEKRGLGLRMPSDVEIDLAKGPQGLPGGPAL